MYYDRRQDEYLKMRVDIGKNKDQRAKNYIANTRKVQGLGGLYLLVRANIRNISINPTFTVDVLCFCLLIKNVNRIFVECHILPRPPQISPKAPIWKNSHKNDVIPEAQSLYQRRRQDFFLGGGERPGHLKAITRPPQGVRGAKAPGR